MEKNVASQKWIVFAFDRTDNTPKTGDAAQITANLRLDGGAPNSVDDTNPAELEDGFYAFDITQGESNADLILITPVSSTGNIQVIGVPGAVYTVAPNSNALGIESDGDLTKVNLCATNTDTAALAATAQLDLDTITGADGVNLLSATQASVDAIEVATGTTLDDHLTDIKGTAFVKNTHSLIDIEAYVDILDDGTSGNVKIATDVAATLVNTAVIGALGAGLTDITDRLPAALTKGTADSGTNEKMVDAALTEADIDYWKGGIIRFTSGTISGQVRVITDFTPSSDTITFSPVTTQTVVAGVTYEIIPAADVNRAILVDTTTVNTDIPAVQTAVDAVKVVTDAIGATAAANLAKTLGTGGVVPFTVDTVVNTHTPTTTEFQADDVTEATPDHYNGRVVVWLTGSLAGQATDITDYAAVGGIGQFTITALTEAPANNDTGIIV